MGGCESCVMRAGQEVEALEAIAATFKLPPHLNLSEAETTMHTPATTPPETPAAAAVAPIQPPKNNLVVDGYLWCSFRDEERLSSFKRWVIVDERGIHFYRAQEDLERGACDRLIPLAGGSYSCSPDEHNRDRFYISMIMARDEHVPVVMCDVVKNSALAKVFTPKRLEKAPQMSEWVRAVHMQSSRHNPMLLGA